MKNYNILEVIWKYSDFYNLQEIQYSDLLTNFKELMTMEEYAYLLTSFVNENGELLTENINSQLDFFVKKGQLFYNENTDTISFIGNKQIPFENITEKDTHFIHRFMFTFRNKIEERNVEKNVKVVQKSLCIRAV